MNNNFSLLPLIHKLGDNYVLLKIWDDFPSFTPGSDIDLLVLDRFDASTLLQKYLRNFVDDNTTTIRVSESNCHIHIDILNDNSIFFRIDLFDDFNFFTKFSIQNALKTKIFLTRQTIDINKQKIFIPSEEFDLLIRYFEYLEWFERRPDKIKHLDFILSNSNKDQQQQLVLNSHRFIRYIHPNWSEEVNQISTPIESRKHAIHEIFRLIKFVIKKSINK